MGKGLPRSQARARALGDTVRALRLHVDTTISVVGASGIGFGTAVIGDFPEGNLLFLGAIANLRFSGPAGGSSSLVDTWSGNVAIGSAPNADTSLASGEIDLIPSTAIGPATAEAIAQVRATHTAAITGTVYDNTDGSLEVNLNLLVADADISGTVAIRVRGEVEIAYMTMLDD